MAHVRGIAGHALFCAPCAAYFLATERIGMIKPSANGRFLLATACLVLTAILLQVRGHSEIFPPRLPLNSFPLQFGPWTGVDRPIDKDGLDVLGPGEFLVRDSYQADSCEPTNLYIAYFPSQRAGDTIHSPKNCLPGAGWAPVTNDEVTLAIAGHAPFPANRYVIPKEQIENWCCIGIGLMIAE